MKQVKEVGKIFTRYQRRFNLMLDHVDPMTQKSDTFLFCFLAFSKLLPGLPANETVQIPEITIATVLYESVSLGLVFVTDFQRSTAITVIVNVDTRMLAPEMRQKLLHSSSKPRPRILTKQMMINDVFVTSEFWTIFSDPFLSANAWFWGRKCRLHSPKV